LSSSRGLAQISSARGATRSTWTAAVISGTALANRSNTVISAFFGALVLAILTDGFNLIGVSANPLGIIFGSAILLAMIANVYLTRLRRAGAR